MKKHLPRVLGVIGLVLITAIGGLRLVGLEPKDTRPGLWLTGEVVTEPVTDWAFTEEVGEIYVQTRSPYLIPHSVTTYCATFEGELYLFSVYYQGGVFPDDRGWNRNVMRDNRVRLKIGDRLFDRTVTHVTDDAIRSAVHERFSAKYPEWTSPGLQDVHVLRVDP